jgi:hypothetical protein
LAILEKPSGFEQTVNAIKDPVGTVKQLGRIGKETFYDPIIGLSDAANPFIEQKPIDRVNKALGGALTAADAITPFVPEGTIANSLRREAMERMLDDEVARYAASGGGAKYRGVLGIHGSPKSGLTEIRPFAGSAALPSEEVAFAFNATDVLPIDSVASAGNYPTMSAPRAYGRARLAHPTDETTIYAARFPSGTGRDMGLGIRAFTEPGQVVASVPGTTTARDYREAVIAVMTPAEKRRLFELRLKNQLKRSKQMRNIYDIKRSGENIA